MKSKSALLVISGIAIGAAAVFLLTPYKNKKGRKELMKKSKKYKKAFKETAQKYKEKLGEAQDNIPDKTKVAKKKLP